MCYLYFFCLHCLINIHIFDYPDSRLSGLFTLVPPSPDNRGSTVVLLLVLVDCNIGKIAGSFLCSLILRRVRSISSQRESSEGAANDLGHLGIRLLFRRSDTKQTNFRTWLYLHVKLYYILTFHVSIHW